MKIKKESGRRRRPWKEIREKKKKGTTTCNKEQRWKRKRTCIGEK